MLAQTGIVLPSLACSSTILFLPFPLVFFVNQACLELFTGAEDFVSIVVKVVGSVVIFRLRWINFHN